MLAVDDAVLALLRAQVGAEQVHEGQLTPPRPAGAPPRVVTFTLPYVVYASNTGLDDNRRLAGRRVRRSVFFNLTYVGGTREQAKFLGEQLRDVLEFRRLTVAGDPAPKTWKMECEASPRIWRDDDAIQPDGTPLYYGNDEYAVSLMNTRVPTLVVTP